MVGAGNAVYLDQFAVEAQLPDGVITDVQGFGGMHDIVIIGTEEE